MASKEDKIPLHTRFGLRLLQVLLVVFALLLVKRCVDIYHDNRVTSEQLKVEYFDKGFTSGFNKARGLQETQEPYFKNYALRKAYRDGYRQGWDEGRQNETEQ